MGHDRCLLEKEKSLDVPRDGAVCLGHQVDKPSSRKVTCHPSQPLTPHQHHPTRAGTRDPLGDGSGARAPDPCQRYPHLSGSPQPALTSEHPSRVLVQRRPPGATGLGALGRRQQTHHSALHPLQQHRGQQLGLSLVAVNGWDSNPPSMAAASTNVSVSPATWVPAPSYLQLSGLVQQKPC